MLQSKLLDKLLVRLNTPDGIEMWESFLKSEENRDLDLGYISAYNLKTGEWKEYFNMCNTRDEFYYKRTDVQCIEGNIFIQGVMCDSTKSSLGGEYHVDDAPENGVWKINLVTGKKEHLTQELYHDGIYVLNNKLYGIDVGKCDLIYYCGN